MPSPTVINLGSVNIDHVYGVPHLVRAGETLASGKYRREPGGKGFNQSIALAHAGAHVRHIGAVGADGVFLRDQLAAAGVDTGGLRRVDTPTGHAIIQVTPSGENAIVLHPGANHTLKPGEIEQAISSAQPGDWLLTQNETNLVPDAIVCASQSGLRVAVNPAPFTAEVLHWPLAGVEILILNETEAAELGGTRDADTILQRLTAAHPHLTVVLTLGASGVRTAGPLGTHQLPAARVTARDTTAAGDTFIGFLLGRMSCGESFSSALSIAVRAAALSVTRPGAAASIPTLEETLSA